MNDSIKQLLRDAQSIIDSHHDGMGGEVIDEACEIKMKVLRHYLDVPTGKVYTQAWEEYIGRLPADVRPVMIALDDCMDCHNTTRYV